MFSWAKYCYFRHKSWEIWKRSWVLNVTSNKFPTFWLNFIKFSTPILFQKDCGRLPFASKISLQMNIYWFYFVMWCVYDLLLKHFVSWHGHGSSSMSKHYQRYTTTYGFNMHTRRITISMQMNQNLWNFNHVQWQAQYYKIFFEIITYAIMIPWWSFILLSQKIQIT